MQIDPFSFRVCDRSAVSVASLTPLLPPQRRSQSHRTRALTDSQDKHAKQTAHRLRVTNYPKKVCLACGNFRHATQTNHASVAIMIFCVELLLLKFISSIETIILTFAEMRPTRPIQTEHISKPNFANRVRVVNRLAHNLLDALSFIFTSTFFRAANSVQRQHHLRGWNAAHLSFALKWKSADSLPRQVRGLLRQTTHPKPRHTKLTPHQN